MDAATMYVLYASDVYRWLRSRMPNATREDLEDLVSETFLRAVRSIDRYREQPSKGNGRGWLFTLAARTMIDEARHRLGRDMKGGLWTDPLDAAGDPVDRSDELGESLADLDLRGLLARLRPVRRRALELRYIDDLTLRQAARAACRSVQAIYLAEHAALDDLRQILGRAS